MRRICRRCEELTGDAYCITISPMSTNGIIENYFVCNDCTDKIRAYIKTYDHDNGRKENIINGLEIQLEDLQKYADNDQPLSLTQEQAQEIIALLKE